MAHNREIQEAEGEIKNYEEQLEIVITSLQTDPDNSDLLELKLEINQTITELHQLIDRLTAAQKEKVSAPSPPTEEKWSKENHPAFQPGYKRPGAAPSPPPAPEEQQASATFKVNDNVLAKWISGDKAYYPARITAITGSSSAPIYNVTFKSYNTSETLRLNDIKPNNNDSKKRKADVSSAPSSAPSTSGNPNVISAAASIDPDLASQAKREPSKVSDGPTRPPKAPRKVKATKELEAGKNKWQDFTAKGKHGKAAKKGSMFRTGEGINARVGFTGSGHAMRKDPTRSKHIYQTADDE